MTRDHTAVAPPPSAAGHPADLGLAVRMFPAPNRRRWMAQQPLRSALAGLETRKGGPVAFRWDYKGGGELLTSEFMQAEMRRRAAQVMARAEAIAPVGEGPTAGRYKDSFSVESGIRGRGRSRRAYGRVVNDAPEAFYVEYGNVNVDRHRTLGRALDAAKDV